MSGIPLTSMKILPGLQSSAGIAGSGGPAGLVGGIQAPSVAPNSENFADLLGSFITEVESIGAQSGIAKDMFLNGEPIDLHEVMIKGEEAGIAMDLLLEIRNKLVEAYQEVIRMPL